MTNQQCPHCGGSNFDCCQLGKADQFNCYDCGKGWVVTVSDDYDRKAAVDIVITTTDEVEANGDSDVEG